MPTRLVELRIDVGTLVVPVLLCPRQLQRKVAALAACLVQVGHGRTVLRLVGYVIKSRPQRHDRLERGMRRHVGNALAIDPDLAAVAQRIDIAVPVLSIVCPLQAASEAGADETAICPSQPEVARFDACSTKQIGRIQLPLTANEAEDCAVAIVDDHALSTFGKLAAALDRAGLWSVLARAQKGRSAEQLSIVIKPELAGFAIDSPAVTDPALVEELVDLLHVVASPASR